LIGEDAKKSSAAEDVLARIECIDDAHLARRKRHELHHAGGAVDGDHSRVESALDMRDSLQIGARELEEPRSLNEEWSVLLPPRGRRGPLGCAPVRARRARWKRERPPAGLARRRRVCDSHHPAGGGVLIEKLRVCPRAVDEPGEDGEQRDVECVQLAPRGEPRAGYSSSFSRGGIATMS
jgi:hypothetical protein